MSQSLVYSSPHPFVSSSRSPRVLDDPFQFTEDYELLTKWYNLHRSAGSTTMQKVQLRREHDSPFHEFVMLLTEAGYTYRVDRGREGPVLDTLREEGVPPVDAIALLRLTSLKQLDTTSYCAIELRWGSDKTIDLKLVLDICFQIHNNSGKRYKLLTHNCYFFAQTIIMITARKTVICESDEISKGVKSDVVWGVTRDAAMTVITQTMLELRQSSFGQDMYQRMTLESQVKNPQVLEQEVEQVLMRALMQALERELELEQALEGALKAEGLLEEMLKAELERQVKVVLDELEVEQEAEEQQEVEEVEEQEQEEQEEQEQEQDEKEERERAWVRVRTWMRARAWAWVRDGLCWARRSDKWKSTQEKEQEQEKEKEQEKEQEKKRERKRVWRRMERVEREWERAHAQERAWEWVSAEVEWKREQAHAQERAWEREWAEVEWKREQARKQACAQAQAYCWVQERAWMRMRVRAWVRAWVWAGVQVRALEQALERARVCGEQDQTLELELELTWELELMSELVRELAQEVARELARELVQKWGKEIQDRAWGQKWDQVWVWVQEWLQKLEQERVQEHKRKQEHVGLGGQGQLELGQKLGVELGKQLELTLCEQLGKQIGNQLGRCLGNHLGEVLQPQFVLWLMLLQLHHRQQQLQRSQEDEQLIVLQLYEQQRLEQQPKWRLREQFQHLWKLQCELELELSQTALIEVLQLGLIGELKPGWYRKCNEIMLAANADGHGGVWAKWLIENLGRIIIHTLRQEPLVGCSFSKLLKFPASFSASSKINAKAPNVTIEKYQDMEDYMKGILERHLESVPVGLGSRKELRAEILNGMTATWHLVSPQFQHEW